MSFIKVNNKIKAEKIIKLPKNKLKVFYCYLNLHYCHTLNPRFVYYI